ncbi:uncharacterized protein N7511_010133 [Penicillium nucicola]|uniref:uncharacterized protein n=1 Tax=Penicillium nucicola TaxID=1850975 RepID=UPI0025457610|nr:uncharacterized protein N7511_010133 [Penicillium nucicola]KAJ5748437.1 hypothetical protein N7511_010133 [Penicillium nucicola]
MATTMEITGDSLAEELASTSLEDRSRYPEQLLFEPPSGSTVSRSLDDIPRYLFRVVSPQSAGEMNDTWAHSESVRQQNVSSTKDIFSFKDRQNQKTKAKELNVHLRWFNHRIQVEDNLVSWTSSLIFAIQYVYYRYHHDIPSPSLEDIKLYVIDTRLFQRGTFMQDLDLIKAFQDFNYADEPGCYGDLKSLYNLRTSSNYYFGEYLSQGSLKIENKFQVISANLLFDENRLCRLQPALHSLYVPPPARRYTKWASAVVHYHNDIWPSNLPVLSSRDLRERLTAMKEILDSMDTSNSQHSWKFPLGIYLAGLIGFKPAADSPTGNDAIFFEDFRSTVQGGDLGLRDSCRQGNPNTNDLSIIPDVGQEDLGLMSFDFNIVAPDTMPELRHARTLLRETNKHFKLKELKEALNIACEAETSIRALYNRALRPEQRGFTSVDDHNESSRQMGEQVEKKLRDIRELCDGLVSAMARSED